MKVAVFGELYSSNFGDGVITLSAAHLLTEMLPGATVTAYDLGARRSFGNSGRLTDSMDTLQRRRSVLGGLQRLPWLLPLASLVKWGMPGGRHTRRYYDDAVAGADLVVLGGGQILMDNALHYPLRLAYLARACERQGAKLVAHACGLDPRRSRAGAWLMRRALCSPAVAAISCRDNYASLCALLPEFADDSRLFEAYDSALLAAEAFGVTADPASAVIGLGVISPFSYAMVAARSGRTLAEDPQQAVTAYWLALITLLREQGYAIRLFATTGAFDYLFSVQLADQLGWSDEERARMLAPRPQTPEDLVREIAACRAIIAHRLHANIIAYSLGIPAVGIAYDAKVAEFGAVCGRARYITQLATTTPADSAGLLREAMAEGVEPQRQAELKHLTRDAWRRALRQAGVQPC